MILDFSCFFCYNERIMRLKKGKKEKVDDYFSGFLELKNPMFVPIGLVVFEEEDRDGILAAVKEKKIAIVASGQRHPDEVLREMINALQKKEPFCINVTDGLDPRMLNQLSNLAKNEINVHLAGEREPAVLNPVPRGARLVLLMNRELAASLALQDIVSSVCRL